MTDREFGQDAMIADLRDQLAEARADVARFEAALDAANRELAEARRERDFAQEGEENLRHLKKMWEQECGYYVGLWREKSHECSRHRSTIRALVVAARAMWRFVVILHEKNGVPISHAVFSVRLQLWSKHMDDVIAKIGTED